MLIAEGSNEIREMASQTASSKQIYANLSALQKKMALFINLLGKG